jgi:streptogramin lyase
MSIDEPLRVYRIPGLGAEDVLVSEEGRVFTGTEDGTVHEIDPETGDVRAAGHTGGRPMGLEWLPDGRMLVCDAVRGVLALTRPCTATARSSSATPRATIRSRGGGPRWPRTPTPGG